MKGNLYDLWIKNQQNAEKIVDIGEYIVFNGKRFSDAEFFKETEIYKVVKTEPLGVELEVKRGKNKEYVFIYPDGMSSFEVIKKR